MRMAIWHGSPAPLSFDVRADLFSQLAAMEEAGLPVEEALRTTRLPADGPARLGATRKCLRQGLGIADAGEKAGLFTPLEASLLRAAASSGSPQRLYHILSAHYARCSVRMKAMRSRLMLPAVMFVIAVFIKPLPSLLSGTLTLAGYLLKDVVPWIALVGAACLAIELVRRGRPSAHAFSSNPIDRVLLLVPLFGPMQVRRIIRDFFDSLALQLEAGVLMLNALPIALGTVRNHALRSQLSQIKPRIESGASFAQAVAGLGCRARTRARALIQTGEASGALPQMLLRISEAETATIDRFDDLAAEWVPRLAYTSVALMIGYGMFESGAFMRALPQELR
jgi:general secretion pathway protein F